MEALFEFIMANLFFFLLIIGGLYSFFTRMANGGEEQQKKRGQQQQRPRQGQNNQSPRREEQEIDWREIFRQEAAEPERNPHPQSTAQAERYEFEPPSVGDQELQASINKQQALYDRYEEAKEKKQETSRQLSDKVSSFDRAISKDKKRDSLDLNLNNLSNKEVMKAVVWAEVLGRPRSRNPHQSFSGPRRIK
ncbi:hypothetical protein [Halalkalibacterium ligniniphilum]|uniref:hypothetical protein n=1 Tax=Halalkalibacterium ligniniphilum TaxID=1134413 RepID=UPI000349DC2B|nr:hypothetical protein [Halalkalibacterium ligniniphilum]